VKHVDCAEALRVQAYFDGQVDAVSAADIERHIEHCAACSALIQELERTRTAIRRDLIPRRAPAELRARIMHALDQEPVTETARLYGWARSSRPNGGARPFWLGALGGFGITAVAATLAILLLSPSFSTSLLDDLVADHIRSLMPSHLIDVVSTDQHTVKPWFAGHADVSPVVADFAQQGYRLIGGRADYLDHQRAAVVVYQHGAHLINVFSWATSQRTLPKDATRDGYHMSFWRAGDLEYCAVSDTSWDELLGLVRLLRDLSARDRPQ
jgi:anti-sigma factor (TIGR02949 family)